MQNCENKPTKMQTFIQLNCIKANQLVVFMYNSGCVSSLCQHLDDIYTYLNNIKKQNDDLDDPPVLFSNENNSYLLMCQNQLLKTLYSLIQWLVNSPFTEKNQNICAHLIEQIGNQTAVANTQGPAILLCYTYLSNLKKVVFDLDSAYLLVQILNLLTEKMLPKFYASIGNTYKDKFRQMAQKTSAHFLKKDFAINQDHKMLAQSKQANNEAVSTMLNCMLDSKLEYMKFCFTINYLFEMSKNLRIIGNIRTKK
jgi:hypothetical protein